jgi:hypothetical protein
MRVGAGIALAFVKQGDGDDPQVGTFRLTPCEAQIQPCTLAQNFDPLKDIKDQLSVGGNESIKRMSRDFPGACRGAAPFRVSEMGPS